MEHGLYDERVVSISVAQRGEFVNCIEVVYTWQADLVFPYSDMTILMKNAELTVCCCLKDSPD